MTSVSLRSSEKISNLKENQVSFGYYNLDDAKVYKEQGYKFLQVRQFDRAIAAYKKALEQNPNYAEAYYELGKTYEQMGDYSNAIFALNKQLHIDPNNFDGLALLAETYKKNGQFALATKTLEKALNLNYNNDFIKRNLEEVKNYALASSNLMGSYNLKKDQAEKNLREAILIAKEHMSKASLKKLSDINIKFDETAKMSGVPNLAQYEHKARTITITKDFIYADPKLIAAYLLHEFVHAEDNDPYTSIQEEQDAYRVQAQYWIKNSKEVKDPEMDYVAELYSKGKIELDDRVAEIYKQRDPDIAMTSPYHPPGTMGIAANTKLSDGSPNSGQPIRTYDVIC